ncbi:hypothetical protein FQR65_LT01948 [Abscondita terminalis]|nr:hypothetical protein FQR65_LT01948 [Abscondita terminalis]
MRYIFFVLSLVLVARADYWSERHEFIQKQETDMLGSSIILNQKEEKVNEILMKMKHKEYDDGFEHPETFAPSLHFFQGRPLIDKSGVFKFLQKVPKGGALHGHTTAMVSSDYMYKLTYRSNLYGCIIDGILHLKFLNDTHQDHKCNWMQLNVLRVLNPAFDSWLLSQINLYTENPKAKYNSINDVWDAFQNMFTVVKGLVTYRPVFEDFFYQALKELYDDNVMYLEYRGTIPKLYELNGTIATTNQTVAIFKKIINKFKIDYPRFIGARFIYAPNKNDNASMVSAVKAVKELKKNFPDLIAGFDLVGQEDTRSPIVAYLKGLNELSAMGVDFFFHAGETKWYESVSDYNLIDAIQLGTKRIGHGYAVPKHPLVMQAIKQRQIAIELCPISNQVLGLVSDMRNHPGATLIANNVPLVISHDDPAFWNGKGLSYDFYMAFMGMAGRKGDLRLIKQLALNSLTHSTLPTNEKNAAIKSWENDWDHFLDDILATECTVEVKMRSIFLLLSLHLIVRADYWSERHEFIQNEEKMMLGSTIILNEKEKQVNEILMKLKHKEYDEGFTHPETFAPSLHFFEARPLIDRSEVYKFLQKVPKGGALHGHNTALVSSEYLYKLTYRKDLYACILDGLLQLKFLNNTHQDTTCNWMQVNLLRILHPTFDSWLKSNINLYTENPKIKYKGINEVWTAFQNMFSTNYGLVTYGPVFEDYLYQVLQELYDDNVMYIEIRGTLPWLYWLNGTHYNTNQTMSVYKKVIDKFRRDHPRFKGARLIYAPQKGNNASFYDSIKTVKEIKKGFPDLLTGFDLVGQEDTRSPIHAYLNGLRELAAMGIDFFFHAGETKWHETVSDFNLVDAIQLGTKRIGHGYAIPKHPLVMQIIKQRQIAIEVCPISNQVLALVSDMRNHPAAYLIAQGFPIVISNDDPMLWNGKALSYDFYMTFMGIAGRKGDLRLLKQLALNSLIYSTLPAKEKQEVIQDWEIDWNNFIDDILATSVNEIL